MNKYFKNMLRGLKGYLAGVVSGIAISIFLVIGNKIPFQIISTLIWLLALVFIGFPIYGWVVNKFWKWK